MYKSKFSYFGQVGAIFTLGLCVLAALIRFFFGFSEMPGKDRWLLIYWSPFILIVVIFVWRKIILEINRIEISDTGIIFTNLLTRRKLELKKSEVIGFKDTFQYGYKILLIDQSGKVIAKIHEDYYKDFKGLVDNLGVGYMGRIPTIWDRFFGD